MQLWKQNFKLRHVKFQCNLDWGNVYRIRIDLSLAVLNKRFSLTMQPTKNSNAHEKKLTNKAKATSTYSDRVFEKSREVFLHAIMQKQCMESFKWTCHVY